MANCYYCNHNTNMMMTYTKIPICPKCAIQQFRSMLQKDTTYKGTFFKYHTIIDSTVRSSEEVNEYLQSVEDIIIDFFTKENLN